MSLKPEVRITVFSDYICPFCYIGDAVLNLLREEFDLKINWCFLELHPETSKEGVPVTDGYGEEKWNQALETLNSMAQTEKLTLSLPSFTTNSHKALLLAETVKRLEPQHFYSLHNALFHEFFTNHLNIGQEETLRNIALNLGITPSILHSAWNNPQYGEFLENYRKAAAKFNVTATPTFFLGEQRFDGVIDADELINAARSNLEK